MSVGFLAGFNSDGVLIVGFNTEVNALIGVKVERTLFILLSFEIGESPVGRFDNNKVNRFNEFIGNLKTGT